MIQEEAPGFEFGGWFPAGVGIAKNHYRWQEPVFVDCDHAEDHGGLGLAHVNDRGKVIHVDGISPDSVSLIWDEPFPISTIENYVVIEAVHFSTEYMTTAEFLWMCKLIEKTRLAPTLAPPDDESGGRHYLFVDGAYLSLITL